MSFLRRLSQFLILIPLAMLIYDLVYEWFVKARILVRTFREWWQWVDVNSFEAAQDTLRRLLTPDIWRQVLEAPGPAVMLIPPVVIYTIYRIWFAIRGGKGAMGGGYTYKSHD